MSLICGAGGAPWGKLLYAVDGLDEFIIAGHRTLSPPAYAIWVPPGVAHESWTPHDTTYASVYLREDHCAGLPAAPCTLLLGPLLRAIMADFAARAITHPSTAGDIRLAHVLLDQIRLAPQEPSYLPSSSDPLLGPVLAALRATPGDRRSLAEWARTMNTTERTRPDDAVGISASHSMNGGNGSSW